MILTKPSRKNFEFQWLEKKFLETSKVREAIFQNSLFEQIWTDFDWTRLNFTLKAQKSPLGHVLDSKMQSTRRMSVLVALFERYDPNKAFQKKF